MKKIILIAVLTFFCVSAVLAEESVFHVGPFVKGDPFLGDNLKNQLVTGSEKIPKGSNIKIFGHTCASGSPKFNQRLAEWRAQQVAEEIKLIRPDIQIQSIESRPYRTDKKDPNYRMVRVVYPSETPTTKVLSDPETGQRLKALEGKFSELDKNLNKGFERIAGVQEETLDQVKQISGKMDKKVDEMSEALEVDDRPSSILRFLPVFLLVLSTAALLVVIYSMLRDRPQIKKGEDTQEKTKSSDSQNLNGKWIKINSHKIWVETDKEKIYLPFVSSKTGEKMYRSSWRDVKKALKGAFKKPEFSDQVQELKKKGLIKEVKEKEAGT